MGHTLDELSLSPYHTSLEGFGSGDAGRPERRSGDVVSCLRVTVIAPFHRPVGHAAGTHRLRPATTVLTSGPQGPAWAAWQIAKLESEGPGEQVPPGPGRSSAGRWLGLLAPAEVLVVLVLCVGRFAVVSECLIGVAHRLSLGSCRARSC